MFSYGKTNYLQEQSIPEIVKNAFGVYRDYLREIFLSFFLLVFPTSVLGFVVLAVLSSSRPILGLVIYFCVYVLASTIATMAITVIVADVCLGNTPGIGRTWKRLSIRSIGKLLVTTLLFYLSLLTFYLLILAAVMLVAYLLDPNSAIAGGVFIGLMLLMVVGFFALFVMMFLYPVIVVLEKRWGFNALARSVKLGRGYYLRSFIVFALMILFVFLGALLVQFLAAIVLGPLGALIGYLASFLIAPLASIYVVLIYYELRVRKEGYDTDTLEADLRR